MTSSSEASGAFIAIFSRILHQKHGILRTIPICCRRESRSTFNIVIINLITPSSRLYSLGELHDCAFTTTGLANNSYEFTRFNTKTDRLDNMNGMGTKTNIFKFDLTLDGWQSNWIRICRLLGRASMTSARRSTDI